MVHDPSLPPPSEGIDKKPPTAEELVRDYQQGGTPEELGRNATPLAQAEATVGEGHQEAEVAERQDDLFDVNVREAAVNRLVEEVKRGIVPEDANARLEELASEISKVREERSGLIGKWRWYLFTVDSQPEITDREAAREAASSTLFRLRRGIGDYESLMEALGIQTPESDIAAGLEAIRDAESKMMALVEPIFEKFASGGELSAQERYIVEELWREDS